jgi:dephospho-CoA kinase
VSLLLSEGHADARIYPVAVVWSEAKIVRQRHDLRRKRDAAIMQMVIGSQMSKKAGKTLQTLLNEVSESD